MRPRPTPPPDVEAVEALLKDALRESLSTDDGMSRFMDALFGPGRWAYDATEDVWVAPDKDHTGPGRGFVVIERGGSWFTAVLPKASDCQ